MANYVCRRCGKELSSRVIYCSNDCQQKAIYAARERRANTVSVTPAVVTDNQKGAFIQGECCLHCSKPITSGRKDKQFCGATCRKGYSRSKHEAEKALASIESDLNRVYLLLKRKPHSRTDKAISKLKFIHGELGQLLNMYDKNTMIEQARLNELITGYRTKRNQ